MTHLPITIRTSRHVLNRAAPDTLCLQRSNPGRPLALKRWSYLHLFPPRASSLSADRETPIFRKSHATCAPLYAPAKIARFRLPLLVSLGCFVLGVITWGGDSAHH